MIVISGSNPYIELHAMNHILMRYMKNGKQDMEIFMKKIFMFCKKYLFAYKRRLFCYIVVNIAIGIAAFIPQYIIGDFLDQLISAYTIDFIYRYVGLFIAINLISLGLGFISGRLFIKLQVQTSYELSREIIERFQRTPLSYAQKQDAVYLNQRISSDSNALINFCINISQSLIVNVIMIIIPAVLLFTFHPILSSVLLGVVAVYFIFYILYKPILYKVTHNYKESQAHFFSKLNEQLSHVRFIKLHGLFKHFIMRLNNSYSTLFMFALKHQKATYIFSGLDILVVIVAQMILLLFGGRAIISGQLTIGRYIIISSFFSMMLGAIRFFFSLGQQVQTNMVAYNRLQELICIKEESNGQIILDSIDSIELQHVYFSYDNEPVVVDMTCNFEKGHIYAILGPNGSGKSTLVDIILGLHIGSIKGQVTFNGIPIDSINMYEVRKNLIGVTEQEPILLADSLHYNLNLDNTNCTESDTKKMEFLVNILGLNSYLDLLSNRLDTVLHDNATNISGGEKQKLSILRTLLKNPDVMILDEPTSALDFNSSNALKKYLQDIKKDKIIIVITHEKGFISKSDVIVSIKSQ